MTPEQRDTLRDMVTDYGYSREHGHPCEHERLDGVLAFVDSLAGSPEPPTVPGRYRLTVEVEVEQTHGGLAWAVPDNEEYWFGVDLPGLWSGPLEEKP